MITANRYRGNRKNKEEKMNARKAFCVLVVGLALALEITALAGPPSVVYRPGANVIYPGYSYNVAPKVSALVYQVSDCKLPSFYPGWISKGSAKEKPYQAHPGLMSQMYVVPEVRVPTY